MVNKLTQEEFEKLKAQVIPNELEIYEGKLCEVVNSTRIGWWRFHEHYDRDGYCDNPARGY